MAKICEHANMKKRDGILLIKGNANKHANGPLLKRWVKRFLKSGMG